MRGTASWTPKSEDLRVVNIYYWTVHHEVWQKATMSSPVKHATCLTAFYTQLCTKKKCALINIKTSSVAL